jgi:putative intracellular protease/amidase
MSSPPFVIILMADYGHDPTETALPFQAFQKAGYSITFATESGAIPSCDENMLSGWTQKLLGANQATISAYNDMKSSKEIQSPLSWTAADFDLKRYNLVFLPGGHEKGVRQIIDSASVHKHLAEYVPLTQKPSEHCLAAVCHGVMVLSTARDPGTNKSLVHDKTTTALMHGHEQGIFWATRLWLGDYYKTYGAGSKSVEEAVRECLDDPEKQWKGSLSMAPFVVSDEKYNYVSARFPGDVPDMCEEVVKTVRESVKA